MGDYVDLPAKPGSGNQPRVVLDTDAFNEVDDQFAVAYLLHSSDRAETEAVYAAPFAGRGAQTPADGMRQSYEEIGRLLDLCESGAARFPGCQQFLSTGSDTGSGLRPVASAAVTDLVERAMSATHSDRLNIIAIGALTNVASAILAEPEICERCTVIWLGGHHPTWPDQEEFNLRGDTAAARVVFDSGVPLYVVPCRPVASHLMISRPELEMQLDASLPLGAFLLERFTGRVKPGATKVIWDIAAVAWLVQPDAVQSYVLPTPCITPGGSFATDPRRAPYRCAYGVDRDRIFADLFRRIAGGEHT
jgi:purine nucleosidase